MDYAKTSQKLRAQIIRFSGELLAGLPKVARRAMAEMIYGIQALQSVRLTEIGRAGKSESRSARQNIVSVISWAGQAFGTG